MGLSKMRKEPEREREKDAASVPKRASHTDPPTKKHVQGKAEHSTRPKKDDAGKSSSSSTTTTTTPPDGEAGKGELVGRCKFRAPDLSDPKTFCECVMRVSTILATKPNYMTDTAYDFAIQIPKKSDTKRPEPTEHTFMITPVVMLGTFSHIGEYGDYNIDNAKRKYDNDEVCRSKYSAFVICPAETDTPERMMYSQNFNTVKNVIEQFDTQYHQALANPGIKLPMTTEHTEVEKLEDAKFGEDYDPVAYAAYLLERAYRPREKEEKLFPQSSIKRVWKRNETTKTRYVQQVLHFEHNVFSGLYDKKLAAAATESTAQRIATWPVKFRPLLDRFCKTKADAGIVIKTPQNTAYYTLEIVDCVGRSPEEFNLPLKPKYKQDIRGMLSNLIRPVPVSLGVRFGPYVSANNTFHTRVHIVNIALAITWDLFISLMQSEKVSRSVADPKDIEDIIDANAYCIYSDSEESSREDEDAPRNKKKARHNRVEEKEEEEESDHDRGRNRKEKKKGRDHRKSRESTPVSPPPPSPVAGEASGGSPTDSDGESGGSQLSNPPEEDFAEFMGNLPSTPPPPPPATNPPPVQRKNRTHRRRPVSSDEDEEDEPKRSVHRDQPSNRR